MSTRPDGKLYGARIFWKSAPFKGDARPRPRSFSEGARQALEYVLDAPSSRYLAEHGELDPNFSHNVYPSKMLESVKLNDRLRRWRFRNWRYSTGNEDFSRQRQRNELT